MNDNSKILKSLADDIIKRLKDKDIVILRYDAMSTSSIYLKLDYGVANSIRISDHVGKKHLNYRYNISLDKSTQFTCGDKTRFYYHQKDIDAMIERILYDKNAKIAKYGLHNYQKYMRENKQEHAHDKNGFWSSAYLV